MRGLVLAGLRRDDKALLGVWDHLELGLLHAVPVDSRNQGARIVLRVRRLSIVDLSFDV